MAGNKVVAEGPPALEMTPDQVRARGCVVYVYCRCGRKAPISCHQLGDRGLGETPISAFVSKFACRNGCGGPPIIKVEDPYRSTLDPD